MLEKRKSKFDDRVMRDLANAFPDPDPATHKYVVEKDKFSFYLYDSRIKNDGTGEWTKTPVAKFSYLEKENLWQVSWMPPQGRWQKYGRYFDLDTATIVIKGDPAGCFMGSVSPLAYLKERKQGGQATG